MQASSKQTADRARKEADFHDARINDEDENRLGYAYRSVADVYEFCTVPPNLQDRRVLEIGCFRGDQAKALSDFDGTYIGIDISPAAIEHCRKLGLSSAFRFDVDDANQMDSVPDGSLGYAFGNGVLHHLELDRFLPALARKLAPGGVARFVEPAEGNLLLRTFRKLTPHLRTADERPFDQHMIASMRRHFDLVLSHQALMRPYLPMLLLNNDIAVRASRWLDDRLLRIPSLQRQAWLLQIELRKPPGEALSAN